MYVKIFLKHYISHGYTVFLLLLLLPKVLLAFLEVCLIVRLGEDFIINSCTNNFSETYIFIKINILNVVIYIG